MSACTRKSSLSRRKSLALPFVITAAATACTVKTVEEPTATPQAGGENEATPVIISNPPVPRPADAEKKPETGEPNPAPENAGVAPTAEPAPILMRNPPPPSNLGQPDAKIEPIDPATVTKPGKELPKAPASGGRVHVRDDGTCWWQATVKCPPNTMCNPPPPNQVQCAATKPSKPTRPVQKTR